MRTTLRQLNGDVMIVDGMKVETEVIVAIPELLYITRTVDSYNSIKVYGESYEKSSVIPKNGETIHNSSSINRVELRNGVMGISIGSRTNHQKSWDDHQMD